VYNLRCTASRPAKKQTEKQFSCLNKNCSAILMGVRVRYCKDCARARYLYVLTSDRKSKTKQLVRRRRKDIISSIEYHVELAKTTQVLNQAGRSFSTAEFTPQKCSGEESCNGVSLLAKPYCLDCWNANGFGIQESRVVDTNGKSVGLGLFTTKYIKKGAEICYYDGWKVGKDVWRSKSFHSRKQLCDYAMETEKSLIVGNTSFGIATCPILMLLGGIGRYINDPRSARQTNVKYQKKDVDKVIIVATRNILSREELLGSYGNQFNF
jgi:hypothetical protein